MSSVWPERQATTPLRICVDRVSLLFLRLLFLMWEVSLEGADLRSREDLDRF